MNHDNTRYAQQLLRRLSTAKTVDVFITKVARELNTFGLSHWMYSRLDVPNKIIVQEQVGNLGPAFVENYKQQNYHKVDLVLEHLNNHKSATRVYHSQVMRWIKELPFTSKKIQHYKEFLYTASRVFGHEDSFTLANYSVDNGRYLFGVTSKNTSVKTFRQMTFKHMIKLRAIATAVDRIGTRVFPTYFVNPYNRYKTMMSSPGFKYLTTMINDDLGYQETANYFGTSIHVVASELAKFMQQLDVNTPEAAYKKLKEHGFIA